MDIPQPLIDAIRTADRALQVARERAIVMRQAKREQFGEYRRPYIPMTVDEMDAILQRARACHALADFVLEESDRLSDLHGRREPAQSLRSSLRSSLREEDESIYNISHRTGF